MKLKKLQPWQPAFKLRQQNFFALSKEFIHQRIGILMKKIVFMRKNRTRLRYREAPPACYFPLPVCVRNFERRGYRSRRNDRIIFTELVGRPMSNCSACSLFNTSAELIEGFTSLLAKIMNTKNFELGSDSHNQKLTAHL